METKVRGRAGNASAHWEMFPGIRHALSGHGLPIKPGVTVQNVWGLSAGAALLQPCAILTNHQYADSTTANVCMRDAACQHALSHLLPGLCKSAQQCTMPDEAEVDHLDQALLKVEALILLLSSDTHGQNAKSSSGEAAQQTCK